MPEPVLACGQARAGVIRVGKCLTVTFPSAAPGKPVAQMQTEDWEGSGHCKNDAGLLWDSRLKNKQTKRVGNISFRAVQPGFIMKV